MATKLQSPLTRRPDGKVEWTHQKGDKYVVTGVDRDGKRFRLQYDNWGMAQGINVWRGSKWLLRNGKRHKIVSVA